VTSWSALWLNYTYPKILLNPPLSPQPEAEEANRNDNNGVSIRHQVCRSHHHQSLRSSRRRKQKLSHSHSLSCNLSESIYNIKWRLFVCKLKQKVCDCLLKKGPLPLREIVRYTELSETLVRNCLLVLIQHNCLQPFLLEEEGNYYQNGAVSVNIDCNLFIFLNN